MQHNSHAANRPACVPSLACAVHLAREASTVDLAPCTHAAVSRNTEPGSESLPQILMRSAIHRYTAVLLRVSVWHTDEAYLQVAACSIGRGAARGASARQGLQCAGSSVTAMPLTRSSWTSSRASAAYQDLERCSAHSQRSCTCDHSCTSSCGSLCSTCHTVGPRILVAR